MKEDKKTRTMQAIQVRAAGGPEVLELVNLPLPQLKPDWSLVKVKAFGINHSEIFTRQGLSPSVHFPRVLGIECVGEISESHCYPKGQKVVSIMGEMGRAFDGSYAEYVLLPDTQIYPIDSQLDWADLAVIPETYYTAYGSLLNLKVNPEDRILVRAAASGVGTAFAKLLRGQFPNIQLTGSCRNPDKVPLLKSLGFDEVILEKEGRLETRQIFDKILELIGPATIKDTLAHTAPHGIICQTGQLGKLWYLENFDPIEQLGTQPVYLTSFYSGSVDLKKMQALFAYIDHYQVQIKPDKVFKLDQLPLAHTYLESRQGFGKAVVVNN